jgi:hypothetical protein
MTMSTALRPSVRAALSELIDYAGLFPPAELPINAAEREYQAARAGPQAWMLARFIVPASTLVASLDSLRGPFSVIVDDELDALESVTALRERGAPIEAVEIPLRKSSLPLRKTLSTGSVVDALSLLDADIAIAGLGELRVFVEIPRAEGWVQALPAAMSFLFRAHLCAKLRCGGSTSEAFPSVDEVAQFVRTAAQAQVPFKATAGLHHPVRHLDAAGGFTMHGFLNILAAAAFAPRVDDETLRRIVAEEEAGAFTFDDGSFAWRDLRIGASELEEARRRAFVAYGSCSFAEPVEDLIAMGVLRPT